MASVGKTAVAVHWAHRIRDEFPDGQLYLNLRGFAPIGAAMSPVEAVRGFLDALAVPVERVPVGLDAQVGLYRSLLSGGRFLVVLDNAHDADQVRPLLPGAPGCLVVVTSRNQLTSLVSTEGAQPITLDLLTRAEARQLLDRRLGADRVEAEPDAVDEIITRCARLPLALAIVAARAATHPTFRLASLADELRRDPGGLDAFDGGDTASNMRAVFSWSYRTLSSRAARLFRLLGLHSGPDLSAYAAASLDGVPVAAVRPLLAELTRTHLLTEHTPGRYTFHDLLRAYATELTDTVDAGDDRLAALRRLLDHYLHTGHAAALLLQPQRKPITVSPVVDGVVPERLADDGQAMAWFAAEHRVLLATVERAAAAAFDRHTWQLAWTLADYVDRQGLWHDLLATHDAGLVAAQRLTDPIAEAHCRRGLARGSAQLGRYDVADTHYRHALDLYAKLGDPWGQGTTHLAIAVVVERQSRYAEAINHSQQAHDLFKAAGHDAGQANALNNIGWCHVQLGEYALALTFCQRALGLLQEIGDRHGEAGAWDSVGFAHYHLGQYPQAIDCYGRALSLSREHLGDRQHEAESLAHMGDTHHAAGDLDAARRAWREALDIFDTLGHPDAAQVGTKLAGVETP